MTDFIAMVVKQLGLPEGVARQATGAVLGLLQKQLGGGDFNQLLGMLPGAGDLMKQAGGGAGAGGGGLGGALGGLLGGNKGGSSGLGSVAGALGGLLGKDSGAGQAANLLGALTNSGVSADKAGQFAGMFGDYVKGKGGEALLGKALGGIDLKSLLG